MAKVSKLHPKTKEGHNVEVGNGSFEATNKPTDLLTNLNDIREMKSSEIIKIAKKVGVEETPRMNKQDMIYALLKAQSKKQGSVIVAEGVLEILSEGYGFLRSPKYSYLPGPDDIYVSKSQIRSFSLKTGDTVSGQVRLPRDGEKNLALLKIESINYRSPELSRDRSAFENLVPLHPEKKLILEHDKNDFSTRIMDLFIPIGKGQRALIVAPPERVKPYFYKNLRMQLQKTTRK